MDSRNIEIMAATEPLCYLLGIDANKLSKEENLLIEGYLFTCICAVLKEFYKEQNRNYFRLMKFTQEKENSVLENYFISSIIKDILNTKEYTVAGIAHYTDTPEELVEELASGHNTSPSAKFFRKVIELHRSVRRDLYSLIVKKIVTEYFDAA